MDIHHAMMVHNKPYRLYEALTQQSELEVWMGAPALARAEVGSTIEFQFDQGQRTLKMEVTRLEAGKQVQWRVLQPVWPIEAADQVVTWTLTPYESSTLVDLRMEGWPQDDDVYASVSYKWASFMVRLKIYMGDTREIATFLPAEEKKITGNN
ncbi:MAG: SRPBCC family protein [Anaerolineales bacterium]